MSSKKNKNIRKTRGVYNMKDKKFEKEMLDFMLDDAEEYYGMKPDKLTDISYYEQDNRIFSNYTFPKKKFIITAVSVCAVLTGVGFGIGYLTNALTYNDYDNRELYDISKDSAKSYIDTNFNGENFELTFSYSYHDNNIFNFYENQNNNDVLFQCYSTEKNDELQVKFANGNIEKVFTKEKDLNETIAMLNDADFTINKNDIVTGAIYINDNLVKTITMSF